MSELHAFDLETHLIQPGLLWPPIVCGSVSEDEPGTEKLIPRSALRERFARLVREQICGVNLPYDLGCMCAAYPEFVEPVFKMLAEGRVVGADVLEALHDNAQGLLGKDPRTGRPLKDDEGVRYSMALLAERHLGEDLTEEKKNPNSWRFKYATLEGIPLDQWPEDARKYPLGDARHTIDIIKAQLAEGRENISCYASEMRAAWFLALACAWGMRTDPQLVPVVVGEIRRKHEESRRKFIDAGIVRIRKCQKKKNKETGLSEYEEADAIKVEEVEDAIQRLWDLSRAGDWPIGTEWAPARIEELAKILPAIQAGKPVRFATDKGRLKELVERAYRGDPPMTDGGESGQPQVSTSRDTLDESGDELLEDYADSGPNEKLYSTYIDVMEQGVSVPVNPEANVMVATDRTSYRKPNLQQLPRKGSVRECFVPRGYEYK